MFRIVLLLIIFGGLTLFALQNTSLALPLVFLGMQTQPLPLSLWILMAVAAGALTNGAIAALLRISGALPPTSPRRPSGSSSRGFRRPSSSSSRAGQSPPDRPSSSPRTPDPAARDDRYFAEDEEDFLDDEPQAKSRQQTVSPPSSSSYSFSPKNSTSSGVGRPEAVYDAEFKVIIPPYRMPNEPDYVPPATTRSTPNADSDWDDWDEEFGDDDFEDEETRGGSRKG